MSAVTGQTKVLQQLVETKIKIESTKIVENGVIPTSPSSPCVEEVKKSPSPEKVIEEPSNSSSPPKKEEVDQVVPVEPTTSKGDHEATSACAVS